MRGGSYPIGKHALIFLALLLGIFIAKQCDICCLTWLKKSGQSGPGSAARQAAALAEEGVDVHVDSMGEYAVELGRFGWFPDRLPREELGDASDGEAEEAGGSREQT